MMRLSSSRLVHLSSCLIVFSFFAIAFCFELRAQELPAQAVQRALAAHGNRVGSAEIADSVWEGTLTYFGVDGPKGTFDVSLLRKGKTRVQRIVKQGTHEVRQGSDGVARWDSLDGQLVAVAEGRALHFIESQTVRSIQTLFDHQAEGLVLRDRGASGKARVIEAEDKQGRKTSYFIDAETAVINKFEFQAASARDGYVLSDFRRVQGVLTPFKVERYRDGIKVEEMQFRTVRYNTALTDSVFSR